MARESKARFRHEDVSSVPAGWRVRTISHGRHRVRVAFPKGRRQKGAGRLISILHPRDENPCGLRSTNPAELMVMGANPPRSVGRRFWVSARKTKKTGGFLYQLFSKRTREAAEAKSAELRRRGYDPVFIEEGSINPPELMVMAANRKGRIVASETLDAGITTSQAFARGEELERLHPGTKAYFTGGFGTGWRIELREQRHEENPRVEVVHGSNPPVEEIVEEFTGEPAEWIDVYNEPHMPRGRYAQLGELLNLYIKPLAGGQVQKITFGEGDDAPLVVTDQTARQIYFVAGNQDISDALRAFGGRDRGDGKIELGQARRIDYKSRKEHVAAPDEDLWKHEHGEEDGLLPTVLFDAVNKRLLYEGGEYRIEGPWIKN